MNITRNDVDALNAVLTINLEKADYQTRVEEKMKTLRKTMNIPGFRKGQVPMTLLKKQYGQSVLIDEVNRLLQENLSDYLSKEKIEILGNPVPVAKDIDWESDTLSFDFELGLSPKFSIDFDTIKDIKKYNITVDEQSIDEQVENLQNVYGKIVSKEKVEEGDSIRVKATNEEKNIDKESTFKIEDIRTKTNQKKFIGKKVGEVVTISSKSLFEANNVAENVFGSKENLQEEEVEINFEIKEIFVKEKAELNQELFDKLFGEGQVSSLEEMKQNIRKASEEEFKSQAEHKFSNDAIEALIENTKFDLPKEFLIKWMQIANETTLTEEQAAEEYQKSEKGLRYQLIKNKLFEENGLEVNLDDIKEYTAKLIRQQMKNFGQLEPSEEDVTSIVARVLSNQEEVRRITDEVINEKIDKLLAEKIKYTEKEISFKDFLKEAYQN